MKYANRLSDDEIISIIKKTDLSPISIGGKSPVVREDDNIYVKCIKKSSGTYFDNFTWVDEWGKRISCEDYGEMPTLENPVDKELEDDFEVLMLKDFFIEIVPFTEKKKDRDLKEIRPLQLELNKSYYRYMKIRFVESNYIRERQTYLEKAKSGAYASVDDDEFGNAPDGYA